MTRVWRLAIAAGLVSLLLTGCARDHIALRADTSIHINAPRELDRVRLPVTINWAAKGASVAKDLTSAGPFYAVFVDRPPIRAGTSLRSLIDDDCRKQPGCPDLSWFAERFVFVTGDLNLTLPTVPADATGTRTGADHTHRVSIVRVDANGVRLNEAVASVEFAVVPQ
jgi:hypothetical protein